MRATDIIRNLLDIIDSVEQPDSGCGCGGSCGCGADEPAIMVATSDDDELRRFRQILGLFSNDDEGYANSPDEQVSDVDSVTTLAGGGVNGPKHLDDLRGEHGRLYGGN